MSKLTIYHGSDHIIKKPELKKGKKYNDYGQGFYCTEDLELAKEWACKSGKEGFVNEYELDTIDLKVLNLNANGYSILNWIALLLQNRTFTLDNEIQRQAKDYLMNNFLIDVAEYDVIIGYRADDSYFSFAESFISNTLPLSMLNKALRRGNLGEQIALVSPKAFKSIRFIDAQAADRKIYHPKFKARDDKAREEFKKYRNSSAHGKLDLSREIFVLDIIRQEMRNDDERIQRIVSK